MKLQRKMLPPDAAERRHLVTMRHIWRVAEGIIQRGLDPLLAVWPFKGDVAPYERTTPLNIPARPTAYTPLAPGRALPRMSSMRDAELRLLWPRVSPDDLRQYAPWAVSYDEVRRLASRNVSAAELERLVQQAVEIERHAVYPEVVQRRWKSKRSNTAFRLRYGPETAAIFSPDGPIPLPPMPTTVTIQNIERQFEWINMALETEVTDERIILATTRTIDDTIEHTYQTTRRVLGIDIDRDIPGLKEQRALWFREHIDLIESGVMGPMESPALRTPSLLTSAREYLAEAHGRGLRVEEIAGGLRERFGVCERRAELIARDQVLKANGRLTRMRQEAGGITQYRWLTARDARVRDTHRALHNTIQSWDNPPSVGVGRHEHPGGDYQCRCQAIPIAPSWLSEGVEEYPASTFPDNPQTGTLEPEERGPAAPPWRRPGPAIGGRRARR